MLNRKYYPFERNSYYFGKLLTAKDFEAEQKYFNDKRRFTNRLNGSNGIVAGLGVIMADDASIILQAGCAFDASGREIVVPETKVVKLSTIDGFSQLSTNSAFLGISYSEKPVDEVYSAMSADDSDIKHNKIREQYKLTLLDENLVAAIPSQLAEFVGKMVLYSDHDVEVVQYTPKFIPKGSNIAVITEIRRLVAGTGEYSLNYRFESQGLVDGAGNGGADVVINNVKLSFGETKKITTILTPESYLWGGGDIAATITAFNIRKNDEIFTLKHNLELTLRPVEEDIAGHYLSSYYNKSMDKLLSESYDERLWIGRVRLIRQNASVIIDSIDPPPYHQYNYNPEQLMALRNLEECLLMYW